MTGSDQSNKLHNDKGVQAPKLAPPSQSQLRARLQVSKGTMTSRTFAGNHLQRGQGPATLQSQHLVNIDDSIFAQNPPYQSYIGRFEGMNRVADMSNTFEEERFKRT